MLTELGTSVKGLGGIAGEISFEISHAASWALTIPRTEHVALLAEKLERDP